MKADKPRIMLAAPGSGSGKTVITCGILQAVINRGINCFSFKCGPDYIDTMFHKQVLSVDGGNLDSFFSDENYLKRSMAEKNTDFEIIEGVMGYYDGIGGNTTAASSYEVAVKSDTPVILIVNCKGASLSLAAVIKGFLEYKDDSRIKGVILNRISEAVAMRLKESIELLGVKFLGYVPECEAARINSRHLGLVLPEEILHFREQFDKLAEQLEKTIDIDAVLRLGAQAPVIEYSEEQKEECVCSIRIGIAKDRAFNFYYKENLSLIEEMGGELVFFSPLSDDKLPENLGGIILGGGYPENYAKQLSENRSMLESVNNAVLNEGLPLMAECGGFLYLHKYLEGSDGVKYKMAGVIDAEAFRTNKLSRFGYIELTGNNGEKIKGHEFHYWDSTDAGNTFTAEKPGSNRKWSCIHSTENIIAGFPHFYYPSNKEFIRKWLVRCEKYKIKIQEDGKCPD